MGVVCLGSRDMQLSDCAAGRGLLPSQPVQALLLTVYIFPRPQGTLLELSLGHEPEPRQSGRALVAAATFGVHS